MKKLVLVIILASQSLVANDSSAVQSLMAGLDTNSLPYLEASWWLAGIDETEKLPYASILALESHIEANPYLSYVSKEKLAQATEGRFIRQPWPLENVEQKKENPSTEFSNKKHESLVVYPNPTYGKLTIEIRREEIEGTLRVLNVTGGVVFSQKVSKGEPIVFINLNSIQSGFYIVQHLNSSGRIVSEKIIRL